MIEDKTNLTDNLCPRKIHEILQKNIDKIGFRIYKVLVFFNYFEVTWLHQFPTNIYKIYARQTTLRTKNAGEGYNNRLNTRVGRRIRPKFLGVY